MSITTHHSGRPATRTPEAGPRQDTGAVTAELIHKVNTEEVFLTGWRKADEDAVVLSAQWPSTHRFYRSPAGGYEPSLLAETVRQTFSVLSHACHNVPFGHHLIWDHLSFRVSPAALLMGPRPASLTLYAACRPTFSRRGDLTAMSLEVTLERDGMLLGTALTRFTVHAPAIYARLRRMRTDAAGTMARAVPVPPALRLPGRAPEDVVLADGPVPGRWQLRVDTGHPVLFDHPLDHAPGMLLLESAQQAARAALGAGTEIHSLSMTFQQYAELDAPCWITPTVTREGAESVVQVHAEQDGRAVFTARVICREPA